jgi:hypothetical protein
MLHMKLVEKSHFHFNDLIICMDAVQLFEYAMRYTKNIGGGENSGDVTFTFLLSSQWRGRTRNRMRK